MKRQTHMTATITTVERWLSTLNRTVRLTVAILAVDCIIESSPCSLWLVTFALLPTQNMFSCTDSGSAEWRHRRHRKCTTNRQHGTSARSWTVDEIWNISIYAKINKLQSEQLFWWLAKIRIKFAIPNKSLSTVFVCARKWSTGQRASQLSHIAIIWNTDRVWSLCKVHCPNVTICRQNRDQNNGTKIKRMIPLHTRVESGKQRKW